MATSPISAEAGAAHTGGPAQAIFRRLDALVRQKPELASAVAFYRALLPILYIDLAEVATFTLDSIAAYEPEDKGLAEGEFERVREGLLRVADRIDPGGRLVQFVIRLNF